jgi:hypothetical protein
MESERALKQTYARILGRLVNLTIHADDWIIASKEVKD